MKTLTHQKQSLRSSHDEELCVRNLKRQAYSSAAKEVPTIGDSNYPYDLNFMVTICSCKPKCFNTSLPQIHTSKNLTFGLPWIFLLDCCSILHTLFKTNQEAEANTLTHWKYKRPKNTQISKEPNLSLRSLKSPSCESQEQQKQRVYHQFGSTLWGSASIINLATAEAARLSSSLFLNKNKKFKSHRPKSNGTYGTESLWNLEYLYEISKPIINHKYKNHSIKLNILWLR